MVAVLVSAFAIPAFGYSDGDTTGVSRPEREGLRESVDWLKLRPLWRQVAEAHPPEDDRPRVSGVVVGRTLFGVEVVRLWQDGDVSLARSETNCRAGLLALAGFAGGMVMLSGLTFLALWQSE